MKTDLLSSGVRRFHRRTPPKKGREDQINPRTCFGRCGDSFFGLLQTEEDHQKNGGKDDDGNEHRGAAAEAAVKAAAVTRTGMDADHRMGMKAKVRSAAERMQVMMKMGKMMMMESEHD